MANAPAEPAANFFAFFPKFMSRKYGPARVSRGNGERAPVRAAPPTVPRNWRLSKGLLNLIFVPKLTEGKVGVWAAGLLVE